MSKGEKRAIEKLVKRSFNMNKKRNFFMVATIALTTFMLTCIFSLSMSWLETTNANHIRMAGTTAHGSFSSPTPEQLEQLMTLDYIRDFGISVFVGQVIDTEQLGGIVLSMMYADENYWNFLLPARTDIVGNRPIDRHEIMLSREVLDRMGIDQPELGMDISLTYVLPGEAIVYERIFRLSGFYTGFEHLTFPPREQRTVWMSEAFYLYSGGNLQEHGSVSLLLESDDFTQGIETQLEVDLGLTLMQLISLMSSLNNLTFGELNIIPVVVTTVIILLMTGGLSIYGVFYTSVLKDIRFFGLLNAVGISKRQLTRVVFGQIWRLCFIGIPIGLLLGFIISYSLIPFIMSSSLTGVVHSFSPLIYVGAIFFVYLITLISGTVSVRKTTKLSVIEAVKYIGKQETKKKNKKYIKKILPKMAFGNVFRDKKRAWMIFSSLFLGGASFVLVTVLVSSLDTDRFIESIVASDIVIENRSTSQSNPQLFDPFFVEEIASLQGVENVYSFTQEPVSIVYSPAFDPHIYDHVRNQNALFKDLGLEFEVTIEDILSNFTGLMVGIDSGTVEAWDERGITPNRIDIPAFEHGEIVLISATEPNLYTELSEIEIAFLDGDTFTISFGGVLPLLEVFSHYQVDIILFVSHSFMESQVIDPLLTEIRLTVHEGYEEEVYLYIKEITEDIAFSTNVRSQFEFQQLIQRDIMSLYLLGVSISVVLAFTGVLNVMNSMLVSVMIRKREFAMLESIGMTKLHLRKMLMYEGLCIALVTLFMVGTLGNAIAILFYHLVSRSGIWMNFAYPFIPIFVTGFSILIVSILIPMIAYKMEGDSSIVQRLKEGE